MKGTWNVSIPQLVLTRMEDGEEKKYHVDSAAIGQFSISVWGTLTITWNSSISTISFVYDQRYSEKS